MTRRETNPKLRWTVVRVVGLSIGVLLGVVLVASVPDLPMSVAWATSQDPRYDPTTQDASSFGRAEAVDMARVFAPDDAVQRWVRKGPQRLVYVEPDEILDEATLNRQVWGVAFDSEFTICPPDGSDCFRRPGMTVVILDATSGEFVAGYGVSPP